ncbi:GrpB family protein [Actinoplanes sp. NPDC026619]|uniref:GrpB family protein n=1 Tax=Actinoplanes sp. NPDC026619 TaxID=3155798 RepID=UPI0033EAB45A
MSKRQDPIKIMPYDPGWPDAFEAQRAAVAEALGPWIAGPVEHIGSTSVPGLAAKPIIDMMVCIGAYDDGHSATAALSRIGWLHAPEPGDEAGRKWSFCFPSIELRTHHLHVYESGNPLARQLLAFRDHLRSHPVDAAEYARLKSELAAADRHDRPRYRSGKAPFIQDVLRRAGRP